MKICFSDKPIILQKNSIFLAGPTTRQSLYNDSWRKTACDYLENNLHYDGVVYVPEFENSKVPVDLVPQSTWEREGLINCGAIVFYVCRQMPDMPGFTTNMEFGRYLALRPENTLLCCPEWACKNDYMKWQYSEDRPDAVIHTNLEDILKDAVDVAHKYAEI